MLSKANTFLISGIYFTYKFVIPDTRTTQNKSFFYVFWREKKCESENNPKGGYDTNNIKNIIICIINIKNIIINIIICIKNIIIFMIINIVNIKKYYYLY